MAGKFFEDLVPGQIYRHEPGRTVSEFDNIVFTTLTGNPQPLHLDAEFAKNTEYGERIVNSFLTLGMVVGLTVHDLTLGTTLGNLGLEDVRFPAPLRHGDTVRAETEIVAARPSSSRPHAGIVTFEHRGYRQDGRLVVSCRRTGLMLRKPVEP